MFPVNACILNSRDSPVNELPALYTLMIAASSNVLGRLNHRRLDGADLCPGCPTLQFTLAGTRLMKWSESSVDVPNVTHLFALREKQTRWSGPSVQVGLRPHFFVHYSLMMKDGVSNDRNLMCVLRKCIRVRVDGNKLSTAKGGNCARFKSQETKVREGILNESLLQIA